MKLQFKSTRTELYIEIAVSDLPLYIRKNMIEVSNPVFTNLENQTTSCKTKEIKIDNDENIYNFYKLSPSEEEKCCENPFSNNHPVILKSIMDYTKDMLYILKIIVTIPDDAKFPITLLIKGA